MINSQYYQQKYQIKKIPNIQMYIFNIDRGGTFTDFYIQKIDNNQIIQQHCFKIPSQSNEGDGPILGIKQFLKQNNLYNNIQQLIPNQPIIKINLGTTIVTNALLQKKGSSSVLVLSQGFDDLLTIRNQTRPNIFDLKCKKPQPLTNNVFTIDSRLYRHKISMQSNQVIQVKEDIFCQLPSEEKLNSLINVIKSINYQSIGISLCNSYLSPYAQDNISTILSSKGIPKSSIYKGSNYTQLGYLKRTQTLLLDCYLNPTITKYFTNLIAQFTNPPNLQLNIMKSNGGFTNISSINASQLLLSGPAGGLTSCRYLNQQLSNLFNFTFNNLIALDMGGTSTDISKIYNNQILTKYTYDIQGIQICTPHLDIDTIAAGGGSQLSYINGLLKVGPQSVGSKPGPVCYGIGSKLALTDANILLNRLDIQYFPKIFGQNHNQPPNQQLSKIAFTKLIAEINKSTPNYKQKTIYQLAEGFIQIANELMSKNARKLLIFGNPDALIIFGSASGQHCCAIAQKIGIKHIIIHKYSGILSAYGLSKANKQKQFKMYLGLQFQSHQCNIYQLKNIIMSKKQSNSQYLSIKQLQYDKIVQYVTIAYLGTNYSIKLLFNQNMFQQFQIKHKQHNGFNLPNKAYKIQYYIQTFIKQSKPYLPNNIITSPQSNLQQFILGQTQIFLQGQFKAIKKYHLQGMINCQINGPALILSHTSSILVQQQWNAHVINQNVHLRKIQVISQCTSNNNLEDIAKSEKQCDPIKLTIYSTRLMGIAEQMGKILQKTSISTNIKQRLDFSCGIFDWHGKLLANAPHLPVHLGSMQTAVLQQIKRGIQSGDTILSNHPKAGGSHLPDLTVISCFQLIPSINCYVASRGHHADIGTNTPGSMPPFSKTLNDQGIAIQKYNLFQNNTFKFNQLQQLFKSSRNINNNISDILAQISANQLGIKLINIMVKQYGINQFQQYIQHICNNAKQSIEQMLYQFSLNNQFNPVHSISNVQYMDDGTPLCLKLTIDRNKKQAIFDFNGTGQQVIGNTNAPSSITRSAVLYCLRSLLNTQIPLNSGCLIPITLIIPQNSILNPSPNAAVVGGNVQTSQKLVDLILKPFNSVACSQGTMNNLLFGTSKISYYQTICGGSGAGNGFHGVTTQCHMTNTRITDLEHLQRYYPVILMQFKKRTGSGGKGKYRGGDGAIRDILFLEQMEVSVLSQRRVFSPYGINGGGNGLTGKNLLITCDGVKKNIGSKNCFKVNRYDRVVIYTPGGGGYGLQQQ